MLVRALATTTAIAIRRGLLPAMDARRRRARGKLLDFVLQLPAGHSLVVRDAPALDLSPDGRYLAYIAQRSGQQAIYLRRNRRV